MAVIGMRRSGKTTFLWQCLADRLKSGTPRDALLYFNFEDERLAEMTALELQWVVEEHFSLHPARRDSQQVTFFLDEIQGVPGWETFVRRLLDAEKVELFLSGSSARLLSREVATSMRGRAMEVLVHPFSLREALRHRGAEPASAWDNLPKAARSTRCRRALPCPNDCAGNRSSHGYWATNLRRQGQRGEEREPSDGGRLSGNSMP